MRTFLQNKLWRDKLVAYMEKAYGSRIHWRCLDDAAFDEQLRIKLQEEVQEVIAAAHKKELMEELADVYEVIDSLLALHGFDKAEVVALQQKKRDERGGFMGRMFVEVAEHPEGSFGEQYCLAQADKYPEIVSE